VRFELADAAPAIPIMKITKIIGKNGIILKKGNGLNPNKKKTPKPTKMINPIREPIVELFLDIFFYIIIYIFSIFLYFSIFPNNKYISFYLNVSYKR